MAILVSSGLTANPTGLIGPPGTVAALPVDPSGASHRSVLSPSLKDARSLVVPTPGGPGPLTYVGDAAVALATTAPSTFTISMPYRPWAATGVVITSSVFDGPRVALGRRGDAVVRVP